MKGAEKMIRRGAIKSGYFVGKPIIEAMVEIGCGYNKGKGI